MNCITRSLVYQGRTLFHLQNQLYPLLFGYDDQFSQKVQVGQQIRWQHGLKKTGWGFIRESDVDKFMDMQAIPLDEKAIQDMEGDEHAEEEDIFEGIEQQMAQGQTYESSETGIEEGDQEGDNGQEEAEEVEEPMTIEKLTTLFNDISSIDSPEQASDFFHAVNRLHKWDYINHKQEIWPMLYSFCKKMDRICYSMSTDQLATALTAYSRTQYCNSPNGGIANRVMVKNLHRKFENLSIGEMVKSIEAIGASYCGLEGISERLCSKLYDNLEQFTSQELKTIIIALWRMKWYDPLLFDGLLEKLYPKIHELNATEIGDLMQACAHFRHRNGDFVDAVCDYMSSEEMALLRIHPNQAGSFLRACVTLNVRDLIMARRLADKVVDGARGMKTRAVVSTFYAWSMLNFPYEAMDEIVARLGRRFQYRGHRSTSMEEWRDVYLAYYNFKLQKLPLSYNKELVIYVYNRWKNQFRSRRPMWLRWQHESEFDIPKQERYRIHEVSYTMRQLQYKAYELYITKDLLMQIDVAAKIKHIRIAIQVLAKADTSVNEPHIVSARDVCYANMLKMRGWYVIMIPWFKWDKLDSDQRRQAFLLRQLDRAAVVTGVDMYTPGLKNIKPFKKKLRWRQLWD
eukprot:TRINITY_DN2170_c0_g1_i12.p1 TRINITY_DN2170_c0_g1~~TRINITY_DN2170_c0_g1_i12.p1  ORF type:complete len:627 (+),score=64.36 TRINITY_DN2170_c0_g1_i12:210-2090(+)